MNASESYDLNEALAKVYAEQRKLEEAPPPEDASRVAWAAFCARRAGLALERALLERFVTPTVPVEPGQVMGASMQASREEITTDALCAALAKAYGLPPLPWRWGEVRDGEQPRMQWIGSQAGPVLEAWGGASQGPFFSAIARLAAISPAMILESLATRLALSVLEKASPRASEEFAPYLLSARSAVQLWGDHALRTGRPQICWSEAQALTGGQTEVLSWLAALGVITSDPVDGSAQAA